MVNQRKFDPQSPLQEGEFRRIKGIAEMTEKALHEAGIETFEELSMLPPQEIAGKLKGVGVLEKIIQNDWPGQAAEFARQLAEARQMPERNEPQEHQHYASFMVVLLIDEEYQVRRTKISHVQTGLEANWAGWDEPRLVNWIAEQSGLAEQARLTGKGPVAGEFAGVEESGFGKNQEAMHQVLIGPLQISKPQIFSPVSKQVRQTVCPDNPFGIRFKLDFSEVKPSPPNTLMYKAQIQIRRFNGWQPAYQGQFEGNVSPDDDSSYLEALVPGLTEGAYHVEVAVQVYLGSISDPSQDRLDAFAEGIKLRVTWDEPHPVVTDRGEKSPAGYAA